ncbi:uncharacterized protein LOC116957731 [Petromyzon marinus]|uniref:uncharacterized protein LOC116957731 n=1 Tax=Petromyzon marinus TaxID=7757 RepID=UPI003F70198D
MNNFDGKIPLLILRAGTTVIHLTVHHSTAPEGESPSAPESTSLITRDEGPGGARSGRGGAVAPLLGREASSWVRGATRRPRQQQQQEVVVVVFVVVGTGEVVVVFVVVGTGEVVVVFVVVGTGEVVVVFVVVGTGEVVVVFVVVGTGEVVVVFVVVGTGEVVVVFVVVGTGEVVVVFVVVGTGEVVVVFVVVGTGEVVTDRRFKNLLVSVLEVDVWISVRSGAVDNRLLQLNQDPLDALRQRCSRSCESLKAEFSIGESRVTSRTRTQESCAQELLDLPHCQDHCVHLHGNRRSNRCNQHHRDGHRRDRHDYSNFHRHSSNHHHRSNHRSYHHHCQQPQRSNHNQSSNNHHHHSHQYGNYNTAITINIVAMTA